MSTLNGLTRATAALSVLLFLGAVPSRAQLWDDNDYLFSLGPYLVILNEDFSYKRHHRLDSIVALGWGSMDWLPNGDVLLADRGETSGVLARLSPAGEITLINADVAVAGEGGDFFDAKVSPDGQQAFFTSTERIYRLDLDSGAIQQAFVPLGSDPAGGLVARPNADAPGGAEVVIAQTVFGMIAYPLTASGAITTDGVEGRGPYPWAQTMYYDAVTDRILGQNFPSNTLGAVDAGTKEVQEYLVPPGQGLDDTNMHYQGMTVGEDGAVMGVMMSGFEPTDTEALYVWDADGSNFRLVDLDDLEPSLDDLDPPFLISRGILWTGSSPTPVLDLEPESLSSTLETGETESQLLTVANPGDATLEWELCDEVAGLKRVGAIILDGGEDLLSSVVIDPAGEFAYFGTGTAPGRVVKVDLATFQRVGAITLNPGEDALHSALIDPAGEFAYFGTFGTAASSARVVKIDLATFQRVDAITLAVSEGTLRSGVIDPAGEFAYFGTDTFQAGRVVKIDLATFERVGSISLQPGEYHLRSAAIDPLGEFAYFGTFRHSGRVVKIDLATFQRVDGIAVGDFLWTGAIDPQGDAAYFGGQGSSEQLGRVDLDTFELDGTITLSAGETVVRSAVIDPAGEFAYLGMGVSPGRVVKIDLATLQRIGAITLESGENFVHVAAIDPAGDFAYVGTDSVPGRVVKVDLRQPEESLPDWLDVEPAGGSLPAGDEQAVTVTFDASGLAPDTYEAILCVSGNDSASPLRAVPVSLTVTASPAPVLAFDPTSLDFGDVEVGTTGGPLTATLHNIGGAEATDLAFDPVGGDFQADTSDCSTMLPAGASCAVHVTFVPTIPGPAAATLAASSAEGAMAPLDLAGNGTSETEVFTPVALAVDPEPLISDANGVFEPGERVDVAPSWRHDGIEPRDLTGTASDFTGPAGPTYELVTADADYGLVSPGETTGCLVTGLCYQMDIGPLGVERPAVHWDAGFDETLSDDGSRTWTLHVGDSFADVPRSSLFYRPIETLLHHGVSSDPGLAARTLGALGCSADAFCPADATTRAQAAVFLLQGAMDGGIPPPDCVPGEARFDDVPATDPFCPWIEELERRGVTAGCGAGLYCPGSSLTRAQIAVLLLRALEGSQYTPPPCDGTFADVDCPSPFGDWIEDLYARQITSGCGAEPLTYCPAAVVTRGQLAALVTHTFGLVLYGP